MLLALRKYALTAILLIAILPAFGWAQSQPLAVPALTGHVIDQTGTLSGTDTQALEVQLATLEKAHGSQVVVLMVPTTAPEDIAAYANRVGNQWKIGRRDVGDACGFSPAHQAIYGGGYFPGGYVLMDGLLVLRVAAPRHSGVGRNQGKVR